MSKFKVGDKVRVVVSDEYYGLNKGGVHNVVSVHPMGNIVLTGISTIQWSPERFELAQADNVLTPEEVFEHLRNGTKLQWRHKGRGRWRDCINPGNVQVRCILDSQWRVKQEPEVIELNGKKYREIIERLLSK